MKTWICPFGHETHSALQRHEKRTIIFTGTYAADLFLYGVRLIIGLLVFMNRSGSHIVAA